MAQQEYIEAGFLNIVATPHPKGVYLRLMRKAAETPVTYWGDFRAAITKPTVIASADDMYSFQIVAWLELDPDSPTINKSQLKRATFPREAVAFSNAYGVNGRVFSAVLDTKKHLLTIELKNEEGQRITPGRLEMIFTKLLSPKVLGTRAELVEVTVVPRDDALDYVLGFERLDKVDILVKRPNNDDITTATNRVLKRLQKLNAKSERSVLTRQPKTEGIELDAEHMTLARVGAVNGHVDSSGLDKDGAHGKRSTREVPKVVRRVLQKGTSYFAVLWNLAKEARKNSGKL